MAVPVITSLNPLEDNITFQKTTVSNKFYSSKLLNYVESVEIAGFRKTVFYTELNTNLNVGDRIFIVNGNYDSNNFISIDKYTKYTDGYRVLGCDGCRLILDLDYTGELPYVEDNQDNSIKIYHVTSQREFDYINSITVNHEGISFTDDLNSNRIYFGTPDRMSKFCGRKDVLGATPSEFTAVLCADSIIYVDRTWLGSTLLHNRNAGVNGKGFFVRDDVSTSSNPVWVSVTSQIFNNKIKIVNNNLYSNVESNLYINGEDFTLNSVEFKQRNTYRYLNSSWKLDVRYKVSYVSRLNFRFGRFGGEHKDGIFGTNLRRNNWRSAVWTSGTFLNSIWNSGPMNSKSTSGEKSYYTTYENRDTPPVQTIDFSNNRGYGYNLIEDSIILSGVIQNGNFENCNLGRGTTFSALNVYFGQTYSYDLKLSGLYTRCDLNGISSERAKFKNSNIINSSLLSTNLVNSQIYRSSANSSTFTDEEGINVLSADMWSYIYDLTLETSIRGTLKLYISDNDARKVNTLDSFYLTKINKNLFLTNLSNDEKIKLPIETKFLFDIYSDFELDNNKIVVSLKNKNDNKTKSVVRTNGTGLLSTGFSNVFTRNNIEYSSIDIECNNFGWYEGLSLSTSQNIVGGTTLNTGGLLSSQTTRQVVLVQNYILLPITPRNANLFFTGTYIRNADFRSGYFDKSTWLSGANINYKHHVIPFDGINNLNMITAGTETLYIGLEQNRLNANIRIFGEDLSVGDNVWLNSIDHFVGNNVKSIDGRYRVEGIVNGAFREVYLKSLSGLTFSGTAIYKTSQSQSANYSSIHKFQINNSIINSGLLCRTSLKNSTIFNSEFNNFDKNLDIVNIERLRLINILFKDTKNTIKSGYIHKSHVINDTWTSGVIYNSIWNGSIFKNGVFNSGYWQSGVFENGTFINSKDSITSIQSYDNSINLYRNWINGTFENGEFFNSTWFKGTFKNGRFYNSEWYTGLWENGILGSKSIRTIDTKFGYSSPIPSITATNSVWIDGIVENALIGGSGSVYWQNGKFNDGEFTSFGQISTNESIWYNGQFNNGKFSGLARWKDGKFFKGKFHSHYGYTLVSPTNPSTYSTSYGWENGKFLGGEFGTADLGTNSVWYNGEFTGDIFQGRFWYTGLFTSGNFLGSGTNSLLYSSNISNLGEYAFADSFRSRYYGLWYSGNVSDNPKTIKTEERVSTEISRKVEEERVSTVANLRNILWINGTFSHKGGTIQNSLWLNGNFYDGIFDSSIFNSYVDRTFSGLTVSTFASTSSCVWHNGIFESTLGTGSFYISDWKRGTFNNGYMSGATWRYGVWNYGFADNIFWMDGLWRNGNWNGAPFDFTSVDRSQPGTYSVINGRSEDILIHVAKNLGTENIYVNNVFSASTAQQILTDPEITSLNTSTSSVSYTSETYQYTPLQNTTGVSNPSTQYSTSALIPPQTLITSIWQYGTTFSIDPTSFVTNTHVFTTGGENVPGTRISAPSSRLYASLVNSEVVFSTAEKSYVITIKLSVEDNPEVDVFIKVGDKPEVKLTLLSRGETIASRIVYFPRQYDLSFVYTTPSVVLHTDESKELYVRKGNGGILRILYLDIQEREYVYHPEFNNSIFTDSVNLVTNVVSLPSGSEVEILGVSSDANLVSINFGNGIFKSGIWENGIWNNGYRSNEIIGEEDYYKFSNIVGLNGVFPYGGKGTYQISSTTWLVTLQSIQSVEGLNPGDKVSIGNLVAIDINESRKLIKDYFTITQIDLVNNTIVVELVTNFPIVRVERDSENHLIYLTKNIWLTGAFLNGIFKGIWNNGLFKSYPNIGVMANTHWIDGKLDGGRFISRRNDSLGFEYNTGLIQKFIFIDNNATSITESPKFDTWMDLVYQTQSYSTINRDSFLGNIQTYPTLSGFPGLSYSTVSEEVADVVNPQAAGTDNPLQGQITNDVLESLSSFRLSDNTVFKYNLGIKYKVYQNFIPNNGNFLTPFSNNLGSGLNLDNFVDNGWIYKDFADPFFTLQTGTTFSIITLSPFRIDSNVLLSDPNAGSLKRRLRLNTVNQLTSVVIQVWIVGHQTIQIRFDRFILNNENIVTEPDRYYMTSINLHKLRIATASYPNGSGTITSEVNFNLANGINDYSLFEASSDSLTKTQYFFNKKGLDLNIEVSTRLTTPYISSTTPTYTNPTINNRVDVIFNNISFFEVDMIPFFNYYSRSREERIDNRIKTPWFAIAPFIDYSNANFEFLGNIDLTIDSELVNNQANYSIISIGGVGGSVTTPSGGFPDGVIFNSQTQFTVN